MNNKMAQSRCNEHSKALSAWNIVEMQVYWPCIYIGL